MSTYVPAVGIKLFMSVYVYVTTVFESVELYLDTFLTSILDGCVWPPLHSVRFIRG